MAEEVKDLYSLNKLKSRFTMVDFTLLLNSMALLHALPIVFWHLCKSFALDMARVLSVDFGTKRIGIAVTDPLQMIANPLKTLTNDEALPFIKSYVQKENVETIVIGEPKHLDGTSSGPQESLMNFVRAVEKAFPTIKVVRVDERFTSKLAFNALIEGGASKKQRQDKSLLDTMSAVIILQSYLEQKAFGNV